jgi:hypothetical protein
MKERRSVVAAGKEVETRTWWLLLAVVLGSVGCYAVLAVHLVLEATTTNPWMLSWMAVPAVILCASGSHSSWARASPRVNG